MDEKNTLMCFWVIQHKTDRNNFNNRSSTEKKAYDRMMEPLIWSSGCCFSRLLKVFGEKGLEKEKQMQGSKLPIENPKYPIDTNLQLHMTHTHMRLKMGPENR